VYLQEDEEGGHEERLDQVVEEGWSTALPESSASSTFTASELECCKAGTSNIGRTSKHSMRLAAEGFYKCCPSAWDWSMTQVVVAMATCDAHLKHSMPDELRCPADDLAWLSPPAPGSPDHEAAWIRLILWLVPE